MKKLQLKTKSIAIIIALLIFTLTSCQDAGVSQQRLTGEEQNLPNELKGLKVYDVSIGNGNYVKVAVLNGQTNSTTDKVGKVYQSTVIINKQNGSVINVNEIVYENDSIIVCKK